LRGIRALASQLAEKKKKKKPVLPLVGAEGGLLTLNNLSWFSLLSVLTLSGYISIIDRVPTAAFHLIFILVVASCVGSHLIRTHHTTRSKISE
jgi:hypothetical protein